MKKLTTLLLALVLFPALALAVLLEGTVEKVDPAKKQIVLITDKGPETVEFDSATKGMDKAQAGARVTITYSEKGDKRLASEIVVAKAGSPRTSPSDKPGSPGGMKEKSPVEGK